MPPNYSDSELEQLETVRRTARSVLESVDNLRTASKAHIIGNGRPPGWGISEDPGGGFIRAVMFAGSRDAEEQRLGKASLEDLASRYVFERTTKATLGTTDITGGWIVPNAIVDDLIKPARFANPYRSLVTLVPGVNAGTVDIPWRSSAPARAVIAPRGDTKENVNLTYNAYTATMYTIARIHDLAKQFVRQSAGAAEQDVLEELGTALGLGERYYMLSGVGTTEPYGLLTALTNAPATFTSTFASPSDTTVAGSVLAAISTCIGALAARDRTEGLTAVLSGVTYARMFRQGADAAGFWFNGNGGARDLPGLPPGTLVSPFGVPVIADSQLGDDQLIVGQFRSLKLYIGEEARIESSDVAGARWDQNLVGFRGEEDIAFDARPAVYAGAFQQVTNVSP